MRIGVDVGGTNTDAVLMEGSDVVAFFKTATSEDVRSGVTTAICGVMDKASVQPSQIDVVLIGTTQFTNAFVERRNLLPVGVLRLALPAGRGLPPMTDWPEDIRDVVEGSIYQAHGGYEYDGREISSLDEGELEKIALDIRDKRLSTVAISCCFAPLNATMERTAAEIIRSHNPDVRLTLSSEIGRIGLVERENAAIMNACLADLAVSVVDAFRASLKDLGIKAPFFISQNDGTLMSSETVARYPVHTFASGPTNSMRGAAFLTGHENAIVVDIGGTTTDVGVLQNQFPRESTAQVDIGGVRTNFRMPDLISVGLGGGSRVVFDNGECEIGPKSVGYQLEKEACVFGGTTLTATDIAVAAGAVVIGDTSAVSDLDPASVELATQKMHMMVDAAIDRMKPNADKMPVILVGGGAVLVHQELSSASEIYRPDTGSVANAIGAAIAHVGGEIDKVYDYNSMGREQAIKAAKTDAVESAIRAGASRSDVRIVDVDEVPLAYLVGNVRVHAKAVGSLELATG